MPVSSGHRARLLTLAGGLGSLTMGAPASAYIFVDDFEIDRGWQYDEELVAGNACAQAGLGEAVRADDGPALADWSFRVATNETGIAGATNHVIGQNRLLEVGPGGTWRYELWFYADLLALDQAQTGPEFSLQNTHPVGLDWSSGTPSSRWRTHTAGLQYVANPWASRWRIWSDVSAGADPDSEVADWHDLLGLPLVDEEGWHRFELEVDYETNRYQTLTWETPSGTTTTHDLSTWDIAREVKWSEGALWATLEAENLYDCGGAGIHQYEAYYDDVEVEQLTGAIHAAPTAQNLWRTVYAQDSVQLTLGELASDADGDLDPATLTVSVEPVRGTAIVDPVLGTLDYTATAPGGDSVKYTVCDDTFRCTQAWLTIDSPNRAPVGTTTEVTVAAGCSVTLPNPVVDPDGNLDPSTREVDVDPVQGSAEIVGDDDFRYTAPAGWSGEVGFHVSACDEDPWGWCAGAWVVVTVD